MPSSPEQQSPLPPTHALAVSLTLAVCVFLFHVWLPGRIRVKEAELLTAKNLDNNTTQDKKARRVPQALIDYLHQTRPKTVPETDEIKEDDLFYLFKRLEEDYTRKANEIIANRFQAPNLQAGFENPDFKITEGLADLVEFWVHVFGMYDENHVIFYNENRVGFVYSVLDFSELDSTNNQALSLIKSKIIQDEYQRAQGMIKNVARQIQHNPLQLTNLTPEEKRIAEGLLAHKDYLPLDERSLLASLKQRNGFAHKIRQAVVQSGHYMTEMKKIFREHGLPEELTVIPFIESAFKLHAYSRAGATGIWQFIEQTGKRYLKIDEYVDERYDPILATYAAATHLANEYQLLKSWPLTINAYNTGLGRMQQAVRELNTKDIATIIKYFKGAGYGYDSRNYYPEFLAALHVVNNYEEFFGNLTPLPPQEYEYMALPAPMNIKKLSQTSGVSHAVLKNLNLALKPHVLDGNAQLPRGYLLKIPPYARDDITVAMQDLSHGIEYATLHIVKPGESLKKISKMYDLPLDELVAANNILPQQKLNTGDVIKLPSRTSNFGYSSLNPEESEQVVPEQPTSADF